MLTILADHLFPVLQRWIFPLNTFLVALLIYLFNFNLQKSSNKSTRNVFNESFDFGSLRSKKLCNGYQQFKQRFPD